MTEPDHAASAAPARAAEPDFAAQIGSLRAAGADRFDPVQLHYLEALVRRGATQSTQVNRLLAAKLAQALGALQQRFGQAQSDAAQVMDRTNAQTPEAAGTLQQLFGAGDFSGVQRYTRTLDPGQQQPSLGTLVRHLETHAGSGADLHASQKTAARTELNAIRNFRNTWSRLSAQQQVAQSLEQAPKNAGPINSHMLVLRSLALMREISPDYLNQFVSYADTLLRLEQYDKEKQVNAKKPVAPKLTKK
ncbi:hypothetical protein RCH09_003543 [Actimicrobium sp. GrIS 1.19]|uniref:DUF2894 domain-containing protein n=1 Tax=Actimicrobium sp. GrIS 1.19 TaxID=3071708 RepID=UPI002DFAD9C2|nr:hypothetical protein [Actimicrobium sp. GrIS 1.19]